MAVPPIYPVDPLRPDPAVIGRAARVLRDGGLVVLPTETVYGLTADPAQPDALGRVYAAKGRAGDKPLAWLVPGLEAVETRTGPLPPAARALAARFWPGPLTLVLDTPAGPAGFRWPAHAVPLAVMRALGGPIAATSANRSGAPDALSAQEAIAALGAAVTLALDGGPAPGGVASTVVRARADGTEILREGAIKHAALRAALASPAKAGRPGTAAGKET